MATRTTPRSTQRTFYVPFNSVRTVQLLTSGSAFTLTNSEGRTLDLVEDDDHNIRIINGTGDCTILPFTVLSEDAENELLTEVVKPEVPIPKSIELDVLLPQPPRPPEATRPEGVHWTWDLWYMGACEQGIYYCQDFPDEASAWQSFHQPNLKHPVTLLSYMKWWLNSSIHREVLKTEAYKNHEAKCTKDYEKSLRGTNGYDTAIKHQKQLARIKAMQTFPPYWTPEIHPPLDLTLVDSERWSDTYRMVEASNI